MRPWCKLILLRSALLLAARLLTAVQTSLTTMSKCPCMTCTQSSASQLAATFKSPIICMVSTDASKLLGPSAQLPGLIDVSVEHSSML